MHKASGIQVLSTLTYNFSILLTYAFTYIYIPTYIFYKIFAEKKAFEEAANRLKFEAAEKEKLLPELRKKSRRAYLGMRKEQKLQELEEDILDDERLFDEET